MTTSTRLFGLTVLILASPSCLANALNPMQQDGTATSGGGLSGEGGGSSAGGTSSGGGTGMAIMGNPDHLSTVSKCSVPHTPKARGLRRLTGREVTRTLQTVFAASDVPSGMEAFGGDSTVYDFEGIQSVLTVTHGTVVALQVYAEAVGDYASTHVSAVSNCTSQDATCRSSFISSFGKKMFRRPLTADEARAFDSLMGSGSSFNEGVKAVVSAMVQSPYFLYRSELGTPDAKRPGLYALSGYETASALSYLLTGNAPDAALMAAAEANTLSDSNVRIAQAERLLATTDGRDTLTQFFLQWLQVDQIASLARTEGTLTLSTDLKNAMREEVRLTVNSLLANGNSRLKDLFTTSTTYLNGPLLALYGGMGTGDTSFKPVNQASLNRDMGVLGMGGVIAAASQTNIASPTLRGRMVRMRMLCGTIPSPPNSVPPISATAVTDGTIRGLYGAHTANPACQGCHLRMDPLGFTLGNYDTVGRRRPGDMENGRPVDTSGKVTEVGDADVPLSGLSDLSTYLSTSDVAGACFARHLAMYSYGSTTWSQDSCTFDELSEAARASGYNLKATVLALVGLPSFVSRSSDA